MEGTAALIIGALGVMFSAAGWYKVLSDRAKENQNRAVRFNSLELVLGNVEKRLEKIELKLEQKPWSNCPCPPLTEAINERNERLTKAETILAETTRRLEGLENRERITQT